MYTPAIIIIFVCFNVNCLQIDHSLPEKSPNPIGLLFMTIFHHNLTVRTKE